MSKLPPFGPSDRRLAESRFNDGKIVVQAWRSAEMVHVIQEVIHDALWSSGHLSQMGNASIQIPYLTSLLEDFKDAVAEDQQACTSRDGTRPGREIGAWEYTHDQTCGRKKERVRLAANQ